MAGPMGTKDKRKGDPGSPRMPPSFRPNNIYFLNADTKSRVQLLMDATKGSSKASPSARSLPRTVKATTHAAPGRTRQAPRTVSRASTGVKKGPRDTEDVLSSLDLSGTASLPYSVLKDTRLASLVSFYASYKVHRLLAEPMGPCRGTPAPAANSVGLSRGFRTHGTSSEGLHQRRAPIAGGGSSELGSRGHVQQRGKERLGTFNSGTKQNHQGPPGGSPLEMRVEGKSSILQTKKAQPMRLVSRRRSSSSGGDGLRQSESKVQHPTVKSAAPSGLDGSPSAVVAQESADVPAVTSAPAGAVPAPPAPKLLLPRLLLPPLVSEGGSPWEQSSWRSPLSARSGIGVLTWGVPGVLPSLRAPVDGCAAADASRSTRAVRPGPLSPPSKKKTAVRAAESQSATAPAPAAATSVATKGSELLRARVFLCKEGKEVERHKWNLLGDLAAARAAKAKLSKKLQALKALPGALETLKASIGQRLQALELPALLTAFGEGLQQQSRHQGTPRQQFQLVVVPQRRVDGKQQEQRAKAYPHQQTAPGYFSSQLLSTTRAAGVTGSDTWLLLLLLMLLLKEVLPSECTTREASVERQAGGKAAGCGLRDPWASTEGGFQDRTPVEERAAQRRPLDFRYVAFRNPLASVSDEEFFISLARTAHGWCAPQADIPGDNTLRGHGAFALPISRPQKMGDVEIPLSSLKAGRPADSSTLLSRTRLGSNSQLRQPRAAAVLAPPPTAAVAAPAKGFAAGCLPPNVVALDRLGLRKRIARDERLCMSYATKIQVLDTLNLTDFSPHTQTTGTKARCLRPRIEQTGAQNIGIAT
ncbi:hypothetical protein cyc_01955 [Cyclospora cayetanensis]|uniref:Uncharacterized protein n=1 Tax=Cyclospora cayetanensis TaxID=88456 RepID=A0A1D3CVR4_9EIME|nr:hypothetical protein cyc_01955 [Cyclospora cayetanensis]